MHSSRVGTTIRARGAPVSGLAAVSAVMRCSSGTPKAKVLPMPVRAWPMRSSPASASGRVSSWIANGVLDALFGECADDFVADAKAGKCEYGGKFSCVCQFSHTWLTSLSVT